MSRERLTTHVKAARNPRTGQPQDLARIAVVALRSIDLSIRPDPRDGDLAHALIPELNSIDYRDTTGEKWIRERAVRLATGLAKIVYRAPGA